MNEQDIYGESEHAKRIKKEVRDSMIVIRHEELVFKMSNAENNDEIRNIAEKYIQEIVDEVLRVKKIKYLIGQQPYSFKA